MRRPRPAAKRLARPFAALVISALGLQGTALAADIDIYGPKGGGGSPNVVFLLDNTSNWSGNNQGWNAEASATRCLSLSGDERESCRNIVRIIYYTGVNGKKFPWENGYQSNRDNVSLTQGQVQLRALRLVLNELVCSGSSNALDVNIGLAMIGSTGSVLSNGHSTGFIRYAVQPLKGTGTTANSSCKALIDDLDTIDSKITDPTFKAPSSANYGAAMYEVFKYFGGHTHPNLASQASANGATPIGSTGYGPIRFSNPNPLDDPRAFVDPSTRTTYQSPLSIANSCTNNYLVLVGNGYPDAEPTNNGGPVVFNGIGYTPPALSAISSDTSRFADEWAYFLANTDVSSLPGVQRVLTYTINTYKDNPSTSQARLLKSMAAVGGVGPGAYLEIGGDLMGLVNGFKEVLANIASVNSVFTATTLPVSTTTQGTYLNQIFVGMFRPDAGGSPRWVGNLKQYELGLVNGVLDLVDAKGKSAVSAGFFSPLAESYWSRSSVFFTNQPSGTPASASDLPDGAIVEKGGAAQMLRESNLQSSAGRTVYTAPAAGGALTSFSGSNAAVTSSLTAAEIAWARGEANVTSGAGMEDFVGAYLDGSTVRDLGTTGARHSIHGDVLHSKPVALNYGDGRVVVYYGSNDGFFRAIDGRKTGTSRGQELWSFVAPEHYGSIKRLRAGTPMLQIPENSSDGTLLAPAAGTLQKSYGMDGPIGVYARYSRTGAVTEAFLYPTMRRGGRNVYAFNVSDPLNPRYMWKITGGSGDFADLAQTWSMPKPVLFKSASATPPVLLLMGGGYDAAEDSNASSSTGKGNVVYVIDGRDGRRIAALRTEHSVPSDVAVADVDGDGVPDRAYVADVRGNLYRIDFPTTGDLQLSSTWSNVRAVKIAELGGKIFFQPDVVVTTKFVAVLVGTGDREKPLLSSTSDNFFLVKDNLGAPRELPLRKADLTRVAKIDNGSMQPTAVVNPVNNTAGCYVELATNGEKVVNAPFSFSGNTYFGTNRPHPASTNSCSADLGEAYAYKFPLFCGVPTVTKIVGGGLPPSPVGGIVEMTVDGKPVLMPFVIGSGTRGSPFVPERPTPSVAPVRTRLNWRIDNGNR
ncbi:pilus assembly protein [Caldimonas tepidiphila]|uniref:pilus assembly protein n=1 Tax=Caldimonas tepidiphila TaxID=2315841 RepID=UPI001472BBED|nr:PilC/PilY family type IV pilus protein [Caldimonas tepidiphila]